MSVLDNEDPKLSEEYENSTKDIYNKLHALSKPMPHEVALNLRLKTDQIREIIMSRNSFFQIRARKGINEADFTRAS